LDTKRHVHLVDERRHYARIAVAHGHVWMNPVEARFGADTERRRHLQVAEKAVRGVPLVIRHGDNTDHLQDEKQCFHVPAAVHDKTFAFVSYGT
jgi:hypothetical protein